MAPQSPLQTSKSSLQRPPQHICPANADVFLREFITEELTVGRISAENPACRQQAGNLGLAGRVFFEGRLTREQAMARYCEFDVFLFPSLHDTGGYAVIEPCSTLCRSTARTLG